MKLAVMLLGFAVVLAGCFHTTDDVVDPNKLDPVKDLAITVTKNADGSYGFSVPARAGLTFTWDLGDFTTKTGASITHKYGVANGLFGVLLTAKAADGTTLRVGKQHTVGTGKNEAPTAAVSIGVPSVKAGDALAVDASASKDPDGDVLKVTWLLAPAAPKEPSGGGGHGGHRATTLFAIPGPAETEGGEHQHAAGGIDTGNFGPGQSKAVTFEKEGTYYVHCHPHPWMLQKVVVTPGAPAKATADIVEFSYQPAIVRVAPGGTVTYTNKETSPAGVHTVTEALFVPPGTVLPLKTLAGDLVLTEKGAFDVWVLVEDGKGQAAAAKKSILVADEAIPDVFQEGHAGKIDLMVPAAEVFQGSGDKPGRFPFEIQFPGHAQITSAYTVGTPGFGDLVFQLLDADGIRIADGEEISVQIPAGQYFLEVAPTSQALAGVEWVTDILVHLDLTAGPAEGGDGHGDHAH